MVGETEAGMQDRRNSEIEEIEGLITFDSFQDVLSNTVKKGKKIICYMLLFGLQATNKTLSAELKFGC